MKADNRLCKKKRIRVWFFCLSIALSSGALLFYAPFVHATATASPVSASIENSQKAAEEMNILTKKADQGDVDAQKNLGIEYLVGVPVKQDYLLARKWLLKAANQDNAMAQSTLGMMNEKGWGAEPDQTEAVKWFSKAAVQGDTNAQLALGMHYATGSGVRQDLSEGNKWLKKAKLGFQARAENGDHYAQATLGLMYAHGFGTTQDYKEAYFWLLIADKAGVKKAKILRPDVESKLTSQQISEVEKRASMMKPSQATK